jgi:hypothetical protein
VNKFRSKPEDTFRRLKRWKFEDADKFFCDKIRKELVCTDVHTELDRALKHTGWTWNELSNEHFRRGKIKPWPFSIGKK